MWMRNGDGVFNPDTGILFYIETENNLNKIKFTHVSNSYQYQIFQGSMRQCRALLSNITTKLNAVNVEILHNGETESVERELRDMLGD